MRINGLRYLESTWCSAWLIMHIMRLFDKLRRIGIQWDCFVHRVFTVWGGEVYKYIFLKYALWKILDPDLHISWGLEYWGPWKVCFPGNRETSCLDARKNNSLVQLVHSILRKELTWHLPSNRSRWGHDTSFCHLPQGPVYKKQEKDNSFFIDPSCTFCVG